MERLLNNGPVEAEPVEEFAQTIELNRLRERLSDLEEELAEFRQSVERDRQQLGSLLHGLRSVFSGGAAASSQTAEGSVPQPPNEAAWEMWKRRLPAGCGRVIDALLIQPLTMTQMIRACGMAYSTVKGNVAILRANALVERDGEKIKLKRL